MGASPSDRANLAPVDVREHGGWLAYIHGIFLGSYPGSIASSRGAGSESDTTLNITAGRRYASQRSTVALAAALQGRRGEMTPLPTPQALIKQVTGIGDTGAGR